MKLAALRKQKGLTQVKCAEYLGVPIRTYQSYEADDSKSSSIKYMFMCERLEKYGYIDEEHGVLTLEQIKNICGEAFEKYSVHYCYLFGSYAKGSAGETSDVDLIISTNLTGMEFYELVEELREKLRKKVDVLKLEQLKDNLQLIDAVLGSGVKIYG